MKSRHILIVAVGAAAGIGIVTLAPFFGGIGVVNLAGMLFGGGTGGAAGVFAAFRDGRRRDEAIREGKRQSDAAYAERVRGLEVQVARYRERISEQARRERTLLALFSIGIAAAACDGQIQEQERRDLEAIILGVSAKFVSPQLRAEINRLLAEPPTFGDAVRGLEELEDPEVYPLVDTIIEVAVMADGRMTDGKINFCNAWGRYRGARKRSA